jgi:PCO_ADO
MTWIRESLQDDPARLIPDDHDVPGSELAPGVVVDRRSVLWLPISMAATMLFVRNSSASAGDEGGKRGVVDGAARISWGEFLKESRDLASELVKDASGPDQDAYLLRLAALAVRLKAAPATRLGAYGKLNPKVEFGPSYRGVPFVIIQWRMHPNAVLPAHCHPGFSVCTLGLEGEARLRNFEVEGDAPAFNSGSSRIFLIRETHSQLITPGRLNTLSPVRDNIHYFEAGPDGARGIDITTRYSGDGTFSFVAFDPDRPKDARRRTFEATWKGMNL